jgi:hypothetical protein
MIQLLAAVTVLEKSLGFEVLNPDCNMAKAREFEYLLRL